MAHPKLTGRVDRRVVLAAGATAALLGAPASAHALPVDDVERTVECITAACDDQPDAAPSQADPAESEADPTEIPVNSAESPAGLLSETAETVPAPVEKTVTDPITSVVDDVVKSVPGTVSDPVGVVENVPEVVEDVVRGVGDAGGVGPAAPGTPTPVDPRGVTGPRPGVDTAGDSPAGMTPGPRQGPASATPPFRVSAGTPSSGRSASSHPFIAPPVITAPFAADLPRIAEEFISRTPVSEGAQALRDMQRSTVPGPDAPSWLFATAGGLLLLVGTGHLLHARQRYTASVAG